jgi:tetratricopeptide (TPR) repeat protein
MSDFYADQARAQQRAERIRADQQRHSMTAASRGQSRPVLSRGAVRASMISFIVVAIALVLLLSAAPADAQTIHPGEGEFFYETMLALRLGNYYYVKGDYEKAVAYFTKAVESLPVEVYEIDPGYTFMYRMLGDAQTAAGLIDEAEASYAIYTAYTGESLVDIDEEQLVAASLAGN